MILEHFDDFLLHLQTNNYSTETIYNYERDLKVFENFLNDSKIGFGKIDKTTIAYYKAYLVSRDRKTAISLLQRQKQLASISVNRILSSLRSYLKFLIEMDYHCPIAPDAGGSAQPERTTPSVMAGLVRASGKLENVRHSFKPRKS